MANSQSLGAGDGPTSLINTNRSTDAPSSPWTNLPSSVCNVLGSKVDTKGLHAMRLVCTEWQKNVEQSVGLKVKVDASKEGNLEFVKRVKVGSARVLNWTVEIGSEPANHLFQYPDWLQKLKLCGKMPAKWKIHDLCQFPNLAHLVLRDRALHSNNLTGHQYPLVNFDPTSELSADEMLIKACKTQDPTSEAQPIELKSLQTLEIIRYDYYSNSETTELQTHSYLLMMANMCFILSHITSPVLSVAHLKMSVPYDFRGSYDKLNWKLVPLHKFLDNHRTSLRQLYLPHLSGLSSELFQHENLSNSFPNNLQKLILSLLGVPRDPYSREPPDQTTFVYLQKCLQGQTQLQHVYFEFTAFPLKWTSDAFTSIANSCGHTLRYLELQGYPNHDGVLDLEMLSVCQSLEVLHMPWWGRASMTFTNLEKLPVSLKRLIICGGEEGEIVNSDPNVFKRLTALEWISLFGISIRLPIASTSGNQEPERQFCRTMMRGLLGLRQLQGFNLEIHRVGMNGDPSLVKMLSPLDRRINPASRYQFPFVSFNLRYPTYDRTPTPWSDSPLDVRNWDLLEKYEDDEEEPRQLTVLGHILQEMDRNDAGENANDNDEDEDMDLDEVVVSSDEDDF